MRKFQDRRKFRKFVFSSLSFMVLLIISGFLINATFKVYIKNNNAVGKNSAVKMQIAELEKRKSELEAELKRLQTQSGIEEEIRGKFNMQKPGERVLTIVENESEDVNLNNNQENKSFFSNVWTAITNLW